MAYYGGPEKYHSSYAIKVKHLDLNNLSLTNDPFTQFSALIRINETVSKVKNSYFLNFKFFL